MIKEDLIIIKELNKPLLKKWVEELRSGKYKQAKNVLYDKTTGGMCCLGLLCKIQGRDMEKIGPLENTSTLTDYKERPVCHDGEDYDGTINTMKNYSAGLGFYEQKNLAEMNDEGKTFPEIADCVEEKYLK